MATFRAMSGSVQRLKATQMLILATALWGLSFPIMKALTMTQADLLPGRSSWFFASLCIVYRFGAAALIMAVVCAGTLSRMTRLELSHGLGLGLFGGVGILLQMDGLAHTAASTSAFLTQCYCLILPLWVAARDRQWPAPKIFVSSALVIVGVAVLAKVDWRHLQLGRGELETIVASVIFTNRVTHFSLVMFAVMTLVCLPVAFATTQRSGDWTRAYATAPTLVFLAVLVVCCTLGAYLLMNHWQRHVGAAVAGLIYCIEPVCASAFALVLPAWCSAWTGVNYPNETLTPNLLIGGGLITLANVLVQLPFPFARDTAKMKGLQVPSP
jgi:drug/metabolite transporter (DMT)-like permease